MMKRVVITGPDGCGKTVFIKECVNRFQLVGVHAESLSIWDAIHTQDQFSSKQEIMKYIEGLSGWARVHFLQHGLAILSQLIEQNSSELLLIDAYWYKYFLAEAVHQPELMLDTSLFSHLAKVDRVFYLQTSLEAIVSRKKSFSRYECGGQEGSLDQFLCFQCHLHLLWHDFVEKQSDWSILSGDSSPDEIFYDLCERLLLHV